MWRNSEAVNKYPLGDTELPVLEAHHMDAADNKRPEISW